MQYFQRKLYKSLKVPLSRLEPETMYSFGRVSEITRDELKFGKFVKRLRTRFASIFNQILEKQVILKGIMTPEEFAEIKNDLRFDFIKDNYFEELKEAEITRERLTTLRDVQDHIGVYYSKAWVRKNVLRMSEEEVKDMDKEMAKEGPVDGIDDEDEAGTAPPQAAPSTPPTPPPVTPQLSSTTYKNPKNING